MEHSASTTWKKPYDETLQHLKGNYFSNNITSYEREKTLFMEKYTIRVSQLEFATIVVHRNVLSDDDCQKKHVMYFLHYQETTILIWKKKKDNYDYNEELVLLQIYEDIFAQLEIEKPVIHPSSVLEENNDITSTINSSTNIISFSIIES